MTVSSILSVFTFVFNAFSAGITVLFGVAAAGIGLIWLIRVLSR